MMFGNPTDDDMRRARADEERAHYEAEQRAMYEQQEREHHAHQAIEFAIEVLGFDTVVMAAIGHQLASSRRDSVRKGIVEALDFARHNEVHDAHQHAIEHTTVDYFVAKVMGDEQPPATDEPF